MIKLNKIKKVFSGILTTLIVMNVSCITAFASNNIDLTSSNNSASATIQYTEASNWTASIPAFITPSEQSAEVNVNQYRVDISDILLDTDKKLVTTIEYDGVLSEANGVEMQYSLYDADGEVNTGDEIISTESGNPNAVASYSFGAALNQTPKYAGTYIGKATFYFAAADNKTIYTPEDIEKDEHLFAIGKTKPEYVIAKFSEDYTEVEVFANGNESDGIMKDFEIKNYSSNSPISNLYSSLKVATIKQNVTSIGNGAFYNCRSLGNIIIPNSVTSIGNSSFYFCEKLTDLSLPESIITIGSNAFENCKKLENINIPKKITTIKGSTFLSCSSLKNIVIPEGVTEIMGSAFAYCTSLADIVIPNSVSSLYLRCFYECSSLTEISIPNSIEYIGEYAFYNCTSLTNITIPKDLTLIRNNTFDGCSSLTNITIPEGMETISEYAFNNCSSLTSITIPYSVTRIGMCAFDGCTSLQRFTIYDNLVSYGMNKSMTDAFGINGSCVALTDVVILDNGNINQLDITQFDVFGKCPNLKYIHSTAGSVAETWARMNGYTFISIN